MTCLTPPETLAEFVAVIDRCAAAAGGPAWQQLALLGLATIAITGFLVLALVAVLRR